jgi:broad specificity phosphatase PhoE
MGYSSQSSQLYKETTLVIILIAPPETELEENTIWIGTTDTVLSESGRAFAAEFARYDMWINPHRVFCAPAAHMVEFTSILLPFAKPILVDEFTDRSMGSLTGRAYRETMEEFPRRNWLAWQRSYWTAPPEGESLFEISERVLGAFRSKVLPIPLTENVMIVCAPDVMRIILGYLTHTEEVDVPKISIEPVVPYVVNGAIGVTD